VAGVEEGRCGDGGSTENRAGAAWFQGGGIPAAEVQEGGEEVARKLPRGGGAAGRLRDRAAAVDRTAGTAF
jgi:hypothetical protein